MKRGHMGQQNNLPPHVGRYLAGLVEARRVTSDQLAEATGISRDLITQLLAGEQILTGDVAFRLADFFGTSPLVWLDLQRNYYLEARDVEEVGGLIAA